MERGAQKPSVHDELKDLKSPKSILDRLGEMKLNNMIRGKIRGITSTTSKIKKEEAGEYYSDGDWS